MLNTALALTVAAGAAAQVYPDELDILRGADTRPQMELVLDTSGSMINSSDLTTTSCSYYYTNVAGYGVSATNDLVKLDLLKAVLTGCQSPTDGVLDQWANRVFFAIREFGGIYQTYTSRVSVPTGGAFSALLNNQAQLESAVLNLSAAGITPLAMAYAQAAANLAATWSDTNSAVCRQNYIVLMTDGDGNGPTQTISQGAGNSAVTFTDGNATDAGLAARHLAWQDSAPLITPVDSMPAITGVQPIRTYTIGFGTGISSNGQSLLQQMALWGDGIYRAAVGYQQLNDAFTQIILSVVARSNVAFNPGTVQNDGLISGNYVYATSFKPYDKGSWFGNTKKHCIVPANASDTTCILMDDGSGNLIVNANPRDIWTNSTSSNTDAGGTGQVLWNSIMGVTGHTSAVPTTNPYARNIITWTPGGNNYVSVDNTSSWKRQDSYAATTCDHNALVNRLYGYTAQANNCGTNFLPMAIEEWPIGDTVHGDTVLMKYSTNCETSANGDSCFVATVANDGMLHIYRATDGVETAAVIPGHLWERNQIATHQLRDLLDQPNLNEMRRYYFDGGMRLFHDDTNGNGYIDGTESAKLIAGLGRGGKSYIMWDVNTFNGIPNSSNNPPLELMVDQDSSFRHLRETWSAPWLGRHRHADSNVYNVAVFPSGHDRALDVPTANFGGLFQLGLPPPSGENHANPNTQGCGAFFNKVGPAGVLGSVLCSLPFNLTSCTPCQTTAPCGLINCYDWPGYIGNVAVSPFHNGGPSGHNIVLGPFTYTDSQRLGVSYRFNFSNFDLQPGDYLAFLDSSQNEIGRITGSHVGGAVSPWIDDSTFYVRFVSNGTDDARSTGFAVQNVDVVREPLPSTATNSWLPTVYMVDLDNWNGTNGAPATKFPSQPTSGDTRQQTGVLMRITSDCEGIVGPNEVCIDANGTGGQAPQPDLAYMSCPISAEPAVLEEGGLAEGIYWGDECGQIFRAVRDTAGNWTAKRLLATNNLGGANLPVVAGSKDFRKIFANMEIVRSTCNGGSAIGVYFGTGNVQRPATFDNLQDTAVTSFTNQLITSTERNVYGVVWDHPGLPTNATLNDLENVTLAIQVADPTAGLAKNGWFIEMTDQAGILRAPVVFDGVAYFQHYVPQTAATECISATGIEYISALNNCTARPATDGNNNGTIGDSRADRYVGSPTAADIGSGLALMTPPDKPAMITAASGQAITTNNPRTVRYMMWRTTVDPLY